MQTIQRFFTGFFETFRKQGIVGKTAIGCASLIVVCCVCSVPVAILSPSTPTPGANILPSTVNASITPAAQLEQPTATPAPTNPPPPPTPTLNPNLIEPGTYLVGTDIQPGIYTGRAGDNSLDSCYWARLKDLAGGLDSILANENSIGQFYLEVKTGDYALETHCEVVLLSPLPQSSEEFPQKIEPGTYLVGKDIRTGTYKGHAGADISDSCYWARLKDVAGGLNSIIANDNAVGQFYVQVAQGDFALSTACELERVGD